MESIWLDILQVAVALVAVWILFTLATSLLIRNQVTQDYTKPIDTSIINGWVMTQSFFNKRFNTFNPLATNYVELPKAVNRLGGSQFSYSLWVRFDDVSLENLGGKVVFLHGDLDMYEMTKDVNGMTQKIVDFVVKCPLVKFGANGKDIVVEVNTTTEITQQAVVPAKKSMDETMRHNVFSLIPTKFVLWTFVFKDDVLAGNTYESGCIFQMYVNDFLYFTKRFKGTLKLNRGMLSMHPLVGNDKPITGGYLNDLKYYNRALTIADVRLIMARGPPNKRFGDLSGNAPFNEPLYITEYNKLDIYNM